MDETPSVEVTKLDDQTIQVVETQPTPEPVVTSYPLDLLMKNRENALAEIAIQQAIVDQMNSLIDQANKLGITP